MKNLKNRYFNKFAATLLLLVISLNSCTGDLEKLPTNIETNNDQFATVDGYKQALASAFGNLVYSPFLRNFWKMQEHTTDMAVSTWNVDSDRTFHNFEYSADTPAITYVYESALQTITLANNFIIESDPGTVSERGFSGADADDIAQFQAEVKFLRAYCYWVLMDLYGNPPHPTETDLGGGFPEQIQRADLFNWIEAELTGIEGALADPRTNERGRADKAAAWALLSRLYLNAEVYIGTARYDDAANYASKVINAGYALEQNYQWLMLGDNELNTNEFIWTINYESMFETWDGTNFLTVGPCGVTAEVTGSVSSWSMYRFTQQIADLFPTTTATNWDDDKRAMFWTDGQQLEVEVLNDATHGYGGYKYRNVKRDGSRMPQNNTYGNLSDIDFPVFRLAEVYLTYAEAVLRGGNGNRADALMYVNFIRGRAYDNNPSSTLGNITDAELTLDFILDERARELYWEAQRRTDLIRFDKLTTGDYLWAWKGGVKEGRPVDAKYKLFPIPTSDYLANPNLEQIDGF
ncbi:RagB/SusD family nutrient uptake outer membrane protein [Pseudotamlana carrageenivorans]|uniref:RagB/SusD family nutrient uptake outer membrane protein n=1 Tax=Pseudotamlana carrageenivorans TaxID=2069432 RepID=A0A2I7SG64_9FLAO|nr:RagB/SusD family nutrient uptake outer membrane protein [Tamlana carrageenivorans]AUS04897.1 RagB/SusD family nutrient uptake outer membrane protein [Tamlana carrageenivorans]